MNTDILFVEGISEIFLKHYHWFKIYIQACTIAHIQEKNNIYESVQHNMQLYLFTL